MDIQSLHQDIREQTEELAQIKNDIMQASYAVKYFKKEIAEERRTGMLLAMRTGLGKSQANSRVAAKLMVGQIARVHNLKQQLKTNEERLSVLRRRQRVIHDRMKILEALEHSAIGGNIYALHQADIVMSHA